MKSRLLLALVPAIAGLLGLSGCGPDPAGTHVFTRVKSSDGKLEAIYAQDLGGGAAVGVVEEVFVVESGRYPQLRERVFGKECARNLALRWETPRTLRISYDMASDVRDDPRLSKPSLFSAFSSAYWAFDHPHGVSVRLARRVTRPGNGC